MARSWASNTAIYSPSGGNVGIAFAIPSATVEKVVAELRTGGEVARGYMGVQTQGVTGELAESLGLRDARGARWSRRQSRARQPREQACAQVT